MCNHYGPGALVVTLTQGEEQRLRRRGTGSVEAYESWLRARELLTRGTRESVVQARAMYRRAIEIDLNFAAPHAGLALYTPIVLHFLAQANFSLGKYETAAQQLVDRIARNPGTDASRMLLASCYGHLGRAQDARAAWAELLEVNPDFSLMQRARVLPYKDAGDFQRIAEGLAKAGLP